MAREEPIGFIFFTTLFIIILGWNVSYPSNILLYGSIIPLLLFYSSHLSTVPKETIVIVFFAAFIYLFLAIINLTMYESFNFSYLQIFNKKFMHILIIFTFVLLFFYKKVDVLFKGIEYALIFIVTVWIIQLVVYHTTGEYIDLLEPLSGRPQRYQAYFIQSELPFEIIRPTSIYIEPGTYAVNTLPLLILDYLKKNRLTKLHTVTVITYFLSLSLFGIIVATLFLIIAGIHQFEFKINKKNILFIIAMIVIIIGIQEYLFFRFVHEENTGALSIRDNAIGYWQNLSEEDILLGQGNGNTIFEKRAILEDSGFLFKLIFEYGIFALPMLFFMFYITWGLPAIFLLIILITKLHYLIHIVWFYLASVYLLKNEQSKNKEIQ